MPYTRKRGARAYLTEYTEEQMNLACAAVKKGTSLRLAASKFKVPYSTLRDKIRGK